MRNEERWNQFGKRRIENRQVDELIGLSRGLLADGVINKLELEYLVTWLSANVAVSENPIILELYHLIREILSDGVLDAEEVSDLIATLNAFSGDKSEIGETLKSSTLPLCSPPPKVVFDSKLFCLTGTFNFGNRSLCEREIAGRGGICGSLTKKTDFLVIGHYATESWKHSAFGEKILRAVSLREAGVPIHIISEEHWRAHL